MNISIRRPGGDRIARVKGALLVGSRKPLRGAPTPFPMGRNLFFIKEVCDMLFGNKMQQVEKAVEKKKGDKLIELAKAKDAAVGEAAIIGMGKVGGEDCVNFLVTQLRSINPKYRAAAATALGNIGEAHAKAFISSVMKFEKDADAQKAMRDALAKISDY